MRVTDDRCHLDLVHRVDHPGRRAGAREIEAGGRDGAEIDAGAAERVRHERRERAMGAEPGNRLVWEAGIAIDLVRVWACDGLCDSADSVCEVGVTVGRGAHAAAS